MACIDNIPAPNQKLIAQSIANIVTPFSLATLAKLIRIKIAPALDARGNPL